MKSLAGLICILALFVFPIDGKAAQSDHGLDKVEETKSSLSYLDSVILGLVEGITEYLPVSSTGHLILTNAILGLDSPTPALNAEGAPIIVEEDDGTVRPYTIGDAAYAYVIVIQAGAIVAVVLLYWQTIWGLVMGCLGRNPEGLKLAINLIAAFLPAAVIGLLLDDLIESLLGDNVHAVAGALIVGAIVMLGVEKWRKEKNNSEFGSKDGPELHELPIKKALMIGFFQCFAMWPGTSRSMATIVGGYLAGLSPARAAEFSFLLGLITLTAASGYKFVSDGGKMLEALSIGPVLVGCLVAFVSAALAVKWLVTYLSKHGLALFAWYRIVLAIVVLFTVA
ncbi:MAG: undecaprenyl-diphosphate phosphatase [Verrucomicrobiota bacterium]